VTLHHRSVVNYHPASYLPCTVIEIPTAFEISIALLSQQQLHFLNVVVASEVLHDGSSLI